MVLVHFNPREIRSAGEFIPIKISHANALYMKIQLFEINRPRDMVEM
jgi:hypothetical protein